LISFSYPEVRHDSIPIARFLADEIMRRFTPEQIRSLIRGVADLDRKIEEAAAAHPDCFIFESLPGAGAVLAPRLLAAFGS
jgi:hypothetical protein